MYGIATAGDAFARYFKRHQAAGVVAFEVVEGGAAHKCAFAQFDGPAEAGFVGVDVVG